MRRIAVAFLMLAATATTSTAEDGGLPEWLKKTKVGGEIFTDYYYMAQNHDPNLKDANGFWIRRINLGFDTKISDDFSARLRFEGNSPGDFKTSDRIVPYMKDAWVKWQGHSVGAQMGLFGSPTWETVEKTWGYRPVEKTAVELQKMGSSRDFGAALQGKAAQDKIYYTVMVGNGADSKSEVNKGKKVYGALGYRPSKPWVVEVYADHESLPGDTDRKTIQGFVAYRADSGRLGATATRQYRQRPGESDLKLDLISVFGVHKLCDRVKLLARWDHMMTPQSGRRRDRVPALRPDRQVQPAPGRSRYPAA